jgi:hypothetical protein
MNTDLIPSDLGMPTGVALRDPKEILREAGERAQALASMVEETKSYTKIGDGKHLRVEAWITIGQFYGCSARITNVEEIVISGILGFKAHAKVTHDASGMVLSEAESLCMQDEANWDEKPLHQLMSMAQTRAISKALATKFRWVAVLGKFAPTPAEEMVGDEDRPKTKAGKLPAAPRIPYGKSQGKQINDPSVEVDELIELLQGMRKRMAKPDRDPKWDAPNSTLISSLEAEIPARQAKAPASPAADLPKESKRKRESKRADMPEQAWLDLVGAWDEEQHELYMKVKNQFGILTSDELPVDQRWTFYDTMQQAMNSSS